jgi:cytochrome c oxidase subunit 2
MQQYIRQITLILSVYLLIYPVCAPAMVSAVTGMYHPIGFFCCCGIAVIVFAVLICSLIIHRKAQVPSTGHFHRHIGSELIWTIIPFIILILLALPSAERLLDCSKTTQFLDLEVKQRGLEGP